MQKDLPAVYPATIRNAAEYLRRRHIRSRQVDLATTVFNTIEPSAGFPAMAARAPAFDTTAGTMCSAITGRSGGCAKCKRSETDAQTDPQVASSVTTTAAAAIATIATVAGAPVILGDLVTAVRRSSADRCLAGSFRSADRCRCDLRADHQHECCGRDCKKFPNQFESPILGLLLALNVTRKKPRARIHHFPLSAAR
jgi:hypothetical protein